MDSPREVNWAKYLPCMPFAPILLCTKVTYQLLIFHHKVLLITNPESWTLTFKPKLISNMYWSVINCHSRYIIKVPGDTWEFWYTGRSYFFFFLLWRITYSMQERRIWTISCIFGTSGWGKLKFPIGYNGNETTLCSFICTGSPWYYDAVRWARVWIF